MTAAVRPLKAFAQHPVLGAVRLLKVILCVVRGWWLVRTAFKKGTPQERQRKVQAWAKGLLEVLGIQLRLHGQPAPIHGPLIIAANHISWADILVLLAATPCRFVAKAELHRWPLLGVMSQAAGTLFVERQSSRDAMRVMHRMVQGLQDNDMVAIFPEGTTSDGSQVLRFHANLFQAAVTAKVPVQPAVLAYFDLQGQPCNRLAAYVGDDSLLASLWSIATQPGMTVALAFAPAQPFVQQTRREWAQSVESCVRHLHQDVCH